MDEKPTSSGNAGPQNNNEEQTRSGHDDGAGHEPDHTRAQELLVTLWRQISEMRKAGETPVRVVLDPSDYTAIQNYHAHLGTLPNKELDYISKYELFGLPVFVESASAPTVS